MRRGWILILILVALLITGVGAWWWSSPGQLWWMTKKWEWWVLPTAKANPGGADRMELTRALNPQWDRLIRRGFVRPYLRNWFPAPSAAQQAAFERRVLSEIHAPYPPELGGGIGHQVGKTRSDPQTYFIEWLLPPDQHDRLTTIANEELGSPGVPRTEELWMILALPSDL